MMLPNASMSETVEKRGAGIRGYIAPCRLFGQWNFALPIGAPTFSRLKASAHHINAQRSRLSSRDL